jgi:hypothetical protein
MPGQADGREVGVPLQDGARGVLQGREAGRPHQLIQAGPDGQLDLLHQIKQGGRRGLRPGIRGHAGYIALTSVRDDARNEGDAGGGGRRVLATGRAQCCCRDRSTGAAFVEHPCPDLISITASTRAGRDVEAVGGGDLKRVHLELGGKAPVLVFADVDLQAAAGSIAEAAFGNAGQDCAAATRVLVERSAAAEFVGQITERAQSTRYGLPHEDVEYGPLNSEGQLAQRRLQGLQAWKRLVDAGLDGLTRVKHIMTVVP